MRCILGLMRKSRLRILGVIWGILGFVILLSVLAPIISYEITNKKSPDFLSPVPETDVFAASPDYTKASTWFPGGAAKEEFINPKVSFYRISIPKLKISDATVAIGGEDLSKSLIQYPGTALPGKNGNAVIFGHSILPIFYDPEDYISIFSTIDKLKAGDEIKVAHDGVSYIFQVESKFEVLPTDTKVLEQDYSNSFLTLVTCSPPGDPRKPKRLIVKARLVAL